VLAAKVQRFMKFYPRRLKKNSKKDYLKKITLGYRILNKKIEDPLIEEKLPEELDKAFGQLTSTKEKYRKDIFHKMHKFSRFLKNEPKGDYPMDSDDEIEEKPKTRREKKWQELKSKILAAAFKQYKEEYESDDGDEEEPVVEKKSD